MKAYRHCLFALSLAPAVCIAEGASFDVFALLDGRALSSDDVNESWLSGGLDPLRFDDDDGEVELGQAILGGRIELTSTWHLEGYVSAYDDDGSDGLGVNELFFSYRPVPVSPYRWRARLGVFFPPISTENTAQGWTAPSMLTNSAINTWIGEEIKNTGLELSIERPGAFHGSAWDMSADLTVFYRNDPAGSLLAWRGWGMHDRQLRYEEKVPFAALPSFEEGGAFPDQTPWFDPHNEIDDRPGVSLGINFEHADDWLLEFFYYDNRGDPDSLQKGQYAWDTHFYHFGFVSPRFDGVRISGQYLYGNTFMGLSSTPEVDADFDSWFLLAEYRSGRFSYSLRYDDFDVEDKDSTPGDNNDQRGDAWTAAIAYRFSERLSLIAELLAVEDNNEARLYFDQSSGADMRQLQMALQWRL